MRGYVVRRVVSFVVTLGFVSVLVFVAIRVLPGDPVLVMAGAEANPEVVARLRAAMGLDRPLIVQYADWLGGALRGELGVSIQYDVPVGALIVSRLPVTLPLTVMAAFFTLLVALPLGVHAATHARRPGDYLTMIVAQVGLAVPSFWAGLLLILLFSVRLGWFRSGGFEGWTLGFWAAMRSLLLPALALGLFQAAVLIRATRSSLLEVLGEEYVRTARAKGVSERLVIFRHALRNAMIPVVTVAGVQLGQLLAGSIILESVFALPGLGRLALGAIAARDLPVVQGVTLFVASCIVAINFAVDLSYAWLDPRIRHE
ncbi:MAG TPA: ABC transporter permease [Candidatus Acidoferrum sp.]|nr:ABC transporter permease [Candidatus Acidoferrum sp.]